MNSRERFLAFTEFRPVDRPMRWEWSFRKDTTVLWRKQGLPDNVPDQVSWLEYFDLDRGSPWMHDLTPARIQINTNPVPSFSNEVIEDDERYVIQKNDWGAVYKSLKDVVSLQKGIPQYLSFPVKNRNDFLEFKKRLDPLNPTRYPTDWEKLKIGWKGRDYPVYLRVHGWYGLLRELMGVEDLSVNFYDQPELIQEICEFWADFLIQISARAVKEIDLDYVMFWEDLAYKTGPLLSPQHFREFILPSCRRVIDFFRRSGVKRFMVDCDGNVDSITPLWLESGITMLGPYEVSAGMDVATVGKTYKDLIIVGGIDKMEIAKGPKAIEAEVRRRVEPLLARGGYIPTLDHATIPEMSIQDYRYYRKFLQKITEGK